MANADFKVDVHVKMHVDDNTARAAMRIVDIWLNEDFNRVIGEVDTDDGTVRHELTTLEDAEFRLHKEQEA